MENSEAHGGEDYDRKRNNKKQPPPPHCKFSGLGRKVLKTSSRASPKKPNNLEKRVDIEKHRR
jgi:hypothetical protein